jgi:hypothetical protein
MPHPTFNLRYLAKMASLHRLRRRGITQLSKDQARELCSQAAASHPITKIPEHKPRWKQYWRTHDHTKK